MKTCVATLESVSAYSQSRKHNTDKLEKESLADYEIRTWKQKAHVNADGIVTIPPMAFKQGIDAAAKFLSLQIPGKGKATYTKHFRSGVLVQEPLVTGCHINDVKEEWINANADGVRGSGKRVDRCFPTIESWSGTIEFFVLDETITNPVFEDVLIQAGKFIGIGRFRPENGGFYGRFLVKDFAWTSGV